MEAPGLLGQELESLPVAELVAPGAAGGPALNAALSGTLPIAWTGRAGLLAAPLSQGPGNPPIVREKDAYRASFDEQGPRYEPKVRLAEPGPYHVDFHLLQVQSGQTRLFHPGNPQNPPVVPPGQEDRVDYDRGEYLQEQYVAGAGGLEQRFVFPRPFEIQGDLEIEGNLQGNLDPVLVAATGEIQFRTPDGQTLVSYGRALVQDACGERLAATLEFTGRHLRLVVPRAWLEAACFPVEVDPLIGPNFAVSTQPIAGNQERAAVAYAGSGAHLVAWYGAGSGNDVFAQVVSAEGQLISATVPLDTRSYDQQYPDAAGNPDDGEYLVVWQAATGLPANWDVYAQRVSSAGARLGSRITVYSGSDNQQYPAVAYNGTDGEYLVVWQSYNMLTGYSLQAQRLLSDGTLTGTLQTFYTSGSQLSYPDVAFNATDDEYLVSWQQMGMLPGDWNIRDIALHADGSAAGSAYDLATETTAQTLPAVSYSVSDTEYLVCWQSYVDGSSQNDVRGRLAPRSGNPPQSAFGIATGSDDQGAPDVSYDSATGEFLVTWEHKAALGATAWDVSAHRVNGDGGLPGSVIAVYSGSQDQRYPAVAYDAGASHYVVVWQDYRSGSNWDIYEQRLEANGDPSGSDTLVGAQPEGHAQQQAAAAYGSGSGQHLVVWTDGRNGTDDVYGQLVSAGGALVGNPIAIATDGSYPEHSPVVAYDPTHDEYLVAWVRGKPMLTDQGIRARRVSASGALLGPGELDLCRADVDVGNPAVAYNVASGYFLVSWEDNRGGNWDVYARAVLGGSQTTESEFAVFTGTYDQRVPSVATQTTGGTYLVAWQTGSATSADVYVRLTTATATAGEALVLSTAANDQLDPAVAWNAETEEYLAVWSHNNGSDDDVHGRRVDATGKLLGEELTLASGAAAQQYPAVAADEATAGYVVAWQQGSSNADVHACVLSSRGQKLGAELTLAAAANTQQQPALSYDAATGRVLAVWADSRNSATYPDVYGQLYHPLQADFSGTPTNGDAPLAVQFTDASASEADAWRWSFGDGNVTTTQSPLYTYTQAGLFTVTLRVTDTSTGEVGERVRGAYVLVRPVADFSGVPTSGEAPLEVTFTDGSTSGVEAWRWRFGDGATGTETNPVHSYSQAAAYTVTLRVTDTDTGEWDELTRTVYITASPVASFSGSPLTGTAPLSVQFTDGSTAGVEEWAWRFGDGMTDTAPSPAHLYTEAGAFTVTLQVTDTHTGEWDELARPSYVTVAPVAGFSATPTSGSLPLVATFTDSSTPGVDAWDWSFGDGGESAAQDPVYTYTWVGTFTVTLRVTDTHTGEEAVATGTITVTPLVITYTYDPLYRLTGARYNDGTFYGYAYDAVGNRLTYTDSAGVATRYEYDGADRLISTTHSGNTTPYTWTDRGELLSDGVQSYQWDAAGRLVGVSGPGGLQVAYQYDGANGRTRMTVNGVATSYVVDPYSPVDSVSQVLVETIASTSTRNLYGLDLLAQQGGAMTYLGYDALSVRLHIDESGAITAQYRYGPFGEEMGVELEEHGFVGERWDAESGLLYLRTRYYRPEVGRFISKDRARGTPNRPATLNYYMYAEDRPSMLSDPTGMSPLPPDPVPAFDILEDLILPAYFGWTRFGPHLIETKEVTPPSISAYAHDYMDHIRLYDITGSDLMCVDVSRFQWNQEDFSQFEAGLERAARGLEAITGISGKTALTRLFKGPCTWWRGAGCGNFWDVYRSHSRSRAGEVYGLGGRTFGHYKFGDTYAISAFYGYPSWAWDQTDSESENTVVHELGHAFDWFSAYNDQVDWGKSFSADNPEILEHTEWDGRDIMEAWATDFTWAINGENTDFLGVQYVISKILDATNP